MLKTQWTIGKKMLLIGVGVVLALCILGGNSVFTNNSVEDASNLSALRNQQIDIVNRMSQSHLSMMLAAMDSIVDKDEGRVAGERMEAINSNAAFIKDNLNTLEELADTDEEKRLSKETRGAFENLAKGIQVDLVNLIENSSIREQEIHASFIEIDDVLDEYGDGVGDNLAKLEASLQHKSKGAGRGNAEYKEQIDTVNYMRMSHLNLMLAAMDSIVDKDEGNINAERMKTINTEVEYLNEKLNVLEGYAETGAEKQMVSDIRGLMPKLAKGIQVDLANLIKESVAEAKKIQADFLKIDDVLDAYGDQVGENLRGIQESVQEEVKEANEELHGTISRSSVVGLTVFLLALAFSITAFWWVSRSIINSITAIIQDLSVSSDQVSAASGQISQASQQLAEGANEQASGLEESSSSLEEMASMTKQNADNARQANTLASGTRDSAEKGTNAMKKMSTAIEDIKKSSDETAKIIKTIDEIAFQTNLLALNAAVEAARAGEAGKGFAVVAEEVRNLAQRSAEAAKNTASLIEESKENSDNGVKVSQEVGTILEEIVGSVRKVTDLVGEVAAASEEQSKGIDQVNSAVAQMDKVTQQNASNAEESASGSEELNAQAAQLKDMVGNLTALVGGSANKGAGERATAAVKPPPVERRQLHVAETATGLKKRVQGIIHKGDGGAGAETAVPQAHADSRVVKPEEVIPLDDKEKEFADF